MVIAHVSARILGEMRVNFQNLYSAREIIDVYHLVKRFVLFFSVVYYSKFILQVYYPKKQDKGSLSYS